MHRVYLVDKGSMPTLRLALLRRAGDWSATLVALPARFRATVWLLIAASIATAYVLTEAAGGTSSGLTHLFYIPIFVGAFAYGVPGGVIAALAGGACVALVPAEVAAGTVQDTRTWLLRLIAFVVAGAIVGAMTTGLRRRLRRLERLNEQVVLAFVRAIDEMHRYTAEHSTSVARHARAIARELQLDSHSQDRVRWSALLHDIGKLSVPVPILEKTEPLTPAEWHLVRGHPDASVRIVDGIDEFKEYVPGMRHHHERYDGTGYPSGLRGEEIPLDARIIAVADAFDAMTASRAYRAPHTTRDAFTELTRSAGSQFDPDVVQAFKRCQTLPLIKPVWRSIFRGARRARSRTAG
jgi:putative nucleotidyltransferase with HDIG domain